ncbi:hypothetical protein C4901_12860 [Acidiferrobacter sp. SPIII_3]|nr:hypothetical protein C4901_12860 [Acidiferrobacter sp. SPIII_3]
MHRCQETGPGQRLRWVQTQGSQQLRARLKEWHRRFVAYRRTEHGMPANRVVTMGRHRHGRAIAL